MAGMSDEEVQAKLEESLGIKKKPPPAENAAKPGAAKGGPPQPGGSLRPAWLQSRRNQLIAVAAAGAAVLAAAFLLAPRGPARGPAAVGAKLFEGEPHRIEGTDLDLVFTKLEGRAAVDLQVRSASDGRVILGSVLDPAVETGALKETIQGAELDLKLNAVHDEPPMPPWIDLTIRYKPAPQ